MIEGTDRKREEADIQRAHEGGKIKWIYGVNQMKVRVRRASQSVGGVLDVDISK